MLLQDASHLELKPLVRPFRTLYFLDARAEYLPKHYATELARLLFSATPKPEGLIPTES